MVVLKATGGEPIVKERILESRESSKAEPSIMKVLDKLCLPGIKSSRILTVQACFGFVGDSVLNETVGRLVWFQLGCDIALPCRVREVDGVLGSIPACLQRYILIVWVQI